MPSGCRRFRGSPWGFFSFDEATKGGIDNLTRKIQIILEFCQGRQPVRRIEAGEEHRRSENFAGFLNGEDRGQSQGGDPLECRQGATMRRFPLKVVVIACPDRVCFFPPEDRPAFRFAHFSSLPEKPSGHKAEFGWQGEATRLDSFSNEHGHHDGRATGSES